ncbi:family 2A encapsulin nanocompartment cargo protein cysteine desulfurase [Brooklawnia cerclae]|uniref:Cysteine desulfurase n=1 Tax=Brooklawnia cerclae TaxID=349934 RepID=A0ABX0SK62_9ACTN|nr:cysteine desulfurase [Brooklawnia cerclae]NIH57111.1 cysteine desulfurase/selenocysteine lyase [Brooklawnia cerclae]
MTTSEWRAPSLEGQIGRLASLYFPEFATAPSAGPSAAPAITPTVPSALSPQVVPAAAASLGHVVTRVPTGPWAPEIPAPAADAEEYRPRLVRLGEEHSTPPTVGTRADRRPTRGRSQAFVGARSVESVREDFPILAEVVDGKPLVWLDNAATTQRPRAVIDRLVRYYEHENSNVHRAAHALAARSTDAYEASRRTVAGFIGAGSPDEIVFVRGTTEGINLVARSFVRPRLAPGDEVVLTRLEHHANIVPWQIVAAETGAVIKVAPIDDDGQIELGAYSRLFTPRTRFASFAHVANALGTITPAAEMIAIAHSHGVPVLLDAAQSAPHLPLDVRALDVDFLVFSGHKILGPTGIGVVYGKGELLEEAEPYQGGGNMIADVTFEQTIYQPAPAKFEAGTGNIADAVGLAAAIEYVRGLGIENIAAYEHALLVYGTEALRRVPGVRIVGTAAQKATVLSFVLDGHSVEEVGQALSREGIAVRAGHHCAQPALRRFGLEATVRPSIAFYNTCDELDALADVVRNVAGGGVW